eukprot:TRINITY_DN30768_c0_g1_i1.p1 TRINITY_DN30768_c0_g1~~TRINITY_DN30768_c0_g1_i1.p1  ORF type:complete len:362 (-),score=127.20 TRINITY_DN30768_c0_g1_i1:149-1195(-)
MSPVVRIALSLFLCVGASAFTMYGIEGKCKGFLCPNLELDLVYYDNIVRENKLILIPEDAGPAIMAYKRFHAYDNTTGNYYFIATRPASMSKDGLTAYPPDAQVFVISLKNVTLLSKAQLDATVYQNITSLQFDSVAKTLYGIYENILVTIDPVTGAQKEAAQMWNQGTTFLYNRIADYDSATGRLFMSVHNYHADTYHIATYNTRTGNLTISPPVGYDKFQFSQSMAEGIAYNPNDGGVLLLTESRYGCGFERFDPPTQTWKDIMDPNNPEMSNWDAYDYSTMYGSVYAFHAPSNRFFAMVMDGSSGTEQLADIVQFSPGDLQIYDITSSSIDYTNYVIIENDVKSA